MSLDVLLLVGPVGLYLLLAALPPGDRVRRAFGTAAAVLGLLWLCRAADLAPFTGEAGPDRLLTVTLGAWSLAALAAAATQALRPRIAGLGLALGYPLAVVGFLVLALAALLPALPA